MMAEIAIARNAKNSILIADAEESVNKLSLLSLILFVIGTADDAEDINKYAATCNLLNKNKMNIGQPSQVTRDVQ